MSDKHIDAPEVEEESQCNIDNATLEIVQQDSKIPDTAIVTFEGGQENQNNTTIAALEIGQQNPVLEAKVYRKWISKDASETKERDFCCILIDRQGAAIQAIMDLDDHLYFNGELKHHTAYRISKFFCKQTSTYMQVLENPITLFFGRRTSFVELETKDSEFPKHYFELVPHNHLSSRIPYPDPNTSKMIYPKLTDFLGCLRSVSDVVPSGDPSVRQRHRRKVAIESLDGKMIELTMWGEIAHQFRKEFGNMSFPTIIVITACRVSRYNKGIQLGTTSASHFYINPKTRVADDAVEMLKEKYSANPPIAVEKYPSLDNEEEKTRNRQTLGTLLKQNPTSFQGIRFTCEATITAYVSNRNWNYPSCTQCSKASTPIKGIYICANHGEQVPTPYRYNFKAKATDGTGNAEFTFFTEAGEKITGTPCSELRKKFMETGQVSLPKEMTDAIGQKHIFQIQFATSSSKGSGHFIVKDILDIQLPLKQQTEGTSSNLLPEGNIAMNTGVAIKPPLPETNLNSDIEDKTSDAPGTPPEDIVERMAKTIVQTIPHRPSEEKKEQTATPSEEKPLGAKRSLTKDFSTKAKKSRNT